MQLRTFFLTFVVATLSLAGVHAQERFDTLEIGPMVYENVEVLSKTDQDLFITHSRGACNIKVADLDDDLKTKLGYELIDNEFQGGRRPIQLKAVELDPRVAQVNAQMNQELQTALKQVAPGILIGVLGAMALFYLFFCYCCSLICKKAGTEPTVLIWIPILQMFPLFRAAGMSGWSVMGMFTPQIFMAIAAVKLPSDLSPNSSSAMIFLGVMAASVLLPMIISIIWCVKICKARGKSGWLAVLFFLPLTNLLVFLYLAFSGTDEPEPENPGFVTFN